MIDEMGSRIDKLEQSINDLRAEMGQERTPSPSTSLKPKEDPKAADSKQKLHSVWFHLFRNCKAAGTPRGLVAEFLKKVTKSGIVESLLSWANFKQSKDLKKTDETKRQRITGITKLEDANDVGGKSSDKCTLILTEGVSAKALANVLGIILGGGVGTRLYPLTKKRKPTVPLGANYHLIDIPVSNCLNSNISKIYVLTQFNSASLNRHLSRAYTSNMGGYKNEGFVEVLAAQQSPENPNWGHNMCALLSGPLFKPTVVECILPSMLLVQGALPNLSAPTALLQTADTHSSHLMQPQASSYGSIPPSQIPSSGMSPSPGAFMGQQFPNNMPFPRPQKVDTVSREVKKGCVRPNNSRHYLSFVDQGGEGNRSELVEPHLVVQMDTESSVLYQKTCLDYCFEKPIKVPYITTALMYAKLGTEGRKDLFDWLSRQLSGLSNFPDAVNLNYILFQIVMRDGCDL
ncbi:unnamed protein product [Camellia sinensis]